MYNCMKVLIMTIILLLNYLFPTALRFLLDLVFVGMIPYHVDNVTIFFFFWQSCHRIISTETKVVLSEFTVHGHSRNHNSRGKKNSFSTYHRKIKRPFTNHENTLSHPHVANARAIRKFRLLFTLGGGGGGLPYKSDGVIIGNFVGVVRTNFYPLEVPTLNPYIGWKSF